MCFPLKTKVQTKHAGDVVVGKVTDKCRFLCASAVLVAAEYLYKHSVCALYDFVLICKQKASFAFRTATRFSLSGDAFLKKYNRNPVHTPCEGGGSGLAGRIGAYKRVKITACFDKSFPSSLSG